MNLEGQTALITGAGRGIGKTIALKLAESGADIVLADMSPQVAEVRVVVESLGRKCLTFEADVTDLEAIETMVSKLEEAKEEVRLHKAIKKMNKDLMIYK